MEIKIIFSEDGSHTLYVPELNETYHSHKGALRESQYVFIEQGLDYLSKNKEEINILEVGLGTGLNALLSYIYCEEKKVRVNYFTLEPHPLKEEVLAELNYLELLKRKDLVTLFNSLHQSEWAKEVVLSPYFKFFKYQTRLEDFNENVKTNLVFYDAFAPSKQPEMWSLSNFEKIASLTNKGGVLVSYCASGQFKRNLKAAGFAVETLQGPPGKKEMTRGVLN